MMMTESRGFAGTYAVWAPTSV